MATRNGAAGPSNLKSSENLIAVWAETGLPSVTVAARMSPAWRSRRLLSRFMSLPLGFVRPNGEPRRVFLTQQRTCRMKEQGGITARASAAYFLHIRMSVADAAGSADRSGADRL